jgi:tRNA threonylcarbamoyladenosine biosynthesis protein TsaB
VRVIVIDTALGACTAGVWEDGRVLAQRSEVMDRGHSERLGGFVRDAVDEAGGSFAPVERIGVTVGPGSFTGLRVGLAFALGLGQAMGRPVVGLPVLQALAWSLEGGPAGPIASVIDARRGEVYLQTFLDGEPLEAPQARAVDVAQATLSQGRRSWRWAGSGTGLVAVNGAPEVTEPTVAALAALTERLNPADHPPRPLYLRAPDAIPPTRLPGQARPATRSG